MRLSLNMRRLPAIMLMPSLLCACLGNNNSNTAAPVVPVANTVTVSVDGGPAAAPGQINHAYVTVKVCAAGSTASCANIDHVLLDTGSVGLRLVGSVLTAQSLTLATVKDSGGATLEECVAFGGGQTWGPVALADVSMAGETASKVPVQILDDSGSGAAPPATCGANGSLLDSVTSFGANGVLGLGVLLQDCGQGCVAPTSPLPFYYGCSSAGTCTAENAALANQVANVVAMFSSDNNGFLVNLPNLVNANGDAVVQGELIFGLSTQSDNMLPAGLSVLGADANGEFTATLNGAGAVLPALIDSGTDSYSFGDTSIPACATGAFVGYYCPAVAPQNLSVVNTGVGTNNASSTVNFALYDPNSFVAGATALAGLGGGGGSTQFIWGMPFFYGRIVYFGLDQRVAGSYTGPFYAY